MKIPDEREIVAIHVEGPHEHITRFKREDGSEELAATAIRAIKSHEAHYHAQGRLVRVQQCPDCGEEVLWT